MSKNATVTIPYNEYQELLKIKNNYNNIDKIVNEVKSYTPYGSFFNCMRVEINSNELVEILKPKLDPANEIKKFEFVIAD